MGREAPDLLSLRADDAGREHALRVLKLLRNRICRDGPAEYVDCVRAVFLPN
jgi:hypothetical protein